MSYLCITSDISRLVTEYKPDVFKHIINFDIIMQKNEYILRYYNIHKIEITQTW